MKSSNVDTAGQFVKPRNQQSGTSGASPRRPTNNSRHCLAVGRRSKRAGPTLQFSQGDELASRGNVDRLDLAVERFKMENRFQTPAECSSG